MKRFASDADLKAIVRGQLDGTAAGKANIAHRLGISVGQLSIMLRTDRAIGEGVAARLGFRRRVIFEPVEAEAAAEG